MSFRLKIVLGIILIEVLLMVVFNYTTIQFLSHSNRDHLEHEATVTNQHILDAIDKEALQLRDSHKLQQMVNQLIQNSDIAYIRISDMEGVLAESEEEFSTNQHSDKDQSIEIHSPIIVSGINLGSLELGISFHYMSEMAHQVQNRWITMTLIQTALAALFALLLGSYLTRQLQYLQRAVETITEKGAGHQIELHSDHDLRKVTIAFNQMSKRLAESHQQNRLSLKEQKRLTSIARKNEKINRAILSASQDAIITFNSDGSVEEWNHVAETLFGWPSEAQQSLKISDLIMGDSEANEECHDIVKFIQVHMGEAQHRELLATPRNRAPLTVEFSISPIQTDSSPMYTAFIHDLTEQRIRNAELELAAHTFDSNEAIIITDTDNRILKVNRAFTEITGYSAEEAIGETPRLISSGRQSAEFYREMWSTIHQQGSWSGEIYNRKKNGEIFPEYISISAVKGNGTEVTHYIAHFMDISEQKQIEESLKMARLEAEHASESKSRFLATMSHEIRSPLNAILTMNEILKSSGLTPEQQELAHIASEGGNTLMMLINDILDFSKIESGQMKIEEEWFNLAEHLEDVVELLATQGHNKGIEVVTVLSPHLHSRYLGDAVRIRQILINLLNNAIKFTDQGGVILRLLPDSPQRIVIEVEDSGIGISESQQQQIFSEFIQVDSGDNRQYMGSGLGLTIVQRLVDLMGGEITLQSHEGDGSLFRISLPLQGEGSLSPLPPAQQLPQLCLISDNPLLRKGLEEQFALLQAPIVSCSLREEPPLSKAEQSLILLDTIDNLVDDPVSMPSKWQRVALITLQQQHSDTLPREQLDGLLRKPLSLGSINNLLSGNIDQPNLHLPPVSETITHQPITSEKNGQIEILLVEDSPANQAVVMALLKKRNYSVSCANNGQEALKAASKQSYNLILMDLAMPIMDGLEATRQLRRGHSPNQSTPIIAMTANAFADDRERCLAAGMNDYLSKPLNTQQFYSCLQQWQESTTEAERTAQSSELLEIEVMERLAADTSWNALPRILGIYFVETEERIPKMVELYQQQAWQALGDEAHALKSSSGSFGIVRLQAVAREIELSAKEGNITIIEQAMEGLVLLAEHSIEEVKQYLKERTDGTTTTGA